MALITRFLSCVFVLLVAAPIGAAPRVVLVGLDGASWSVIDPLVEAGRMPNLKALLKRGVHAELETVEPVISPVVWTSIATGQPPETHGIGDFFGDARAIQSPTIFERASVQGLRVGTLRVARILAGPGTPRRLRRPRPGCVRTIRPLRTISSSARASLAMPIQTKGCGAAVSSSRVPSRRRGARPRRGTR